MGHADSGILDLVGVTAAQLQDGLVELAHAGSADRVPLRQQPPRRVDRNVAADQRTAFSGPFGAHAAGDEPEVLAVDDLGHGKAVVKLDEVDVFWVHACGLLGALRGLHRGIEGDDVLMAADPR